MSELEKDHECISGYVYADRVEELRKRGLDPEDHPNARFMKRCPECEIKKLARTIGGSAMSWENWVERESLSEGVIVFKNWYPNGLNWACLIHAKENQDTTATGKTHLLSAAATAYIRAGRSAAYWNAGDLTIRRYENLGQHIVDFKGYALLDDLGTEAINLDTRDAVDRILDARYRHRRPTIVTTNLTLDVVQKRYPRFGRRIKSGTVIAWSESPYQGGERIERPRQEFDDFEDYQSRADHRTHSEDYDS